MPPQLFFNYHEFNYDRPQYDIDKVRQVNPQRHEMEQLSGIVHVDKDKLEIVGFRDLTEDEFWVKGHMPGYPLMPGVLICEAAAQLAAFFARKFDLLKAGDYVGFGGMDEIRFRAPIYPPARMIIGLRGGRIKPKARAEFAFQAVVDGQLVAHGGIIGVPIARSVNMRSDRKATS